MNVLVADDDLVSRMVLQAAVEGLGHGCLAAEDGELAWRLYREQHPDVLITDRMMPGIDGLELCRRVRADRGRSYTYVVLATSLSAREHVLAGLEAGADDYLTKPVDPFDLQMRLVVARRVTTLHTQLDAYRAELARLAETDALTHLRNRRSLDADLLSVHARNERYWRPYSVVLLDVDHFKAYNDVAGHQAGDEALKAVAGCLLAQVRQGDGVYRYGGEEILVVLADQDAANGAVSAERLRRAVERLAIPHPGLVPPGRVTVSAGVAAFDPAAARSPSELLRAADEALYRAKAGGRNRVVADQGMRPAGAAAGSPSTSVAGR